MPHRVRRWITCAVVLSLTACKPDNSTRKQALDDESESLIFANFPDSLNTAADTAAIRAAVLAPNPPSGAQFNGVAGDAQFITDSVYASIYPHRGAHAGILKLGKLLARIDASDSVPARGYKHGMNYWVAAKFAGDTAWTAVIVPDSSTGITTFPMKTLSNNGQASGQSMSRWLVGSSTSVAAVGMADGAWATCDGGTCCCTGACDDALMLQMHAQTYKAKAKQR
jgi:hypothetical protein